jgi:hypothetical protein
MKEPIQQEGCQRDILSHITKTTKNTKNTYIEVLCQDT